MMLNPEKGSISNFLQKIQEWGDYRLNPICILELRTTLRSKRFFWIFMGLLLLTATILSIVFLASADSYTNETDRIGKSIFFAFFIMQVIFTAVIFPAFTCTSIIAEKERKSYDLLITSNLSADKIVLGKFLSAFTYMIIFLFATAPLIMISFLFGGVSIFMVVIAYMGLFFLGGLMIIFPLWSSSFYKTMIKATLAGYLSAWMLASFLVPSLIALMSEWLFSGEIARFFSEFGYRQFFVLLSIFLGYVFLFSFPYLAMINRLRSPAEHLKSIGIRVYYLFVTISVLSISNIWYSLEMLEYKKNNKGVIAGDIIEIYLIFVVLFAIGFTICGIAIPLQARLPHVHILAKIKNATTSTEKFLKTCLYPGSYTGTVFNIWVSFLSFIVMYVTAYILTDHFYNIERVYRDYNINLFLFLPIFCWSYIFFISSISAYLHFLLKKETVIIIVGGYILLSCLLTLQFPFSLAFQRSFDVGLFKLSFLSPILASISSSGNITAWATSNYEKVNFFLLGIPLHFYSIVIYLAAGVHFFIKARKLHYKIEKTTLEEEEKLNALQNNTI